MAKLIYGLNQSLDGYVDHDRFAPDAVLFRHFIAHMGRVTGSVYGGRMYEIMRYWDEDHPHFDEAERAYAAAWRSKPSFAVVATNDRVINPELERFMYKRSKATTIEIAGSHAVFVSQPQQVAALIEKAAQ